MNLAPEYEPGRGLIRLPRDHLEGMVAGERAVLDPGDDRGRLLAELGVVADGRLDSALRRVLATLRRPSRRFGLRIESPGAVIRHRGWIAAQGVVTVTGGAEPADIQDIRHAPRPTAAARVLAGLIGLGPTRPVVDLPSHPLPWEAVMAPVREGPGAGWAGAALGPAAMFRLAHLRWSSDGVRPATTAMVLLSAGPDGLVEAVDCDGGYRLGARNPTEVWTGLCALTRARTTTASPARRR